MKIKLLTAQLVIITSVIIVLFYSCANVGNITGGPKDSLAPVMIASKPPMEAVNFKGKKIILRFNEYIDLKDINQEFVSSPPFKEMPKFTVKQKSIHIKFQEELQENTTYNLKFGKAIVDFNEGNINENLQFVFSTKDEIDVHAVSGNLKDASNLETPENTFVALFRENSDSIPYLKMPDYMSKLDTSGNFKIDYIEKGSYKIFAVKDLNNNKMADIFEPHSFLDSLMITQIRQVTKVDSLKAGTILHDKVDIELTDSLTNDTVIVTQTTITEPSNLQMYLFEETKFLQKILDYSRKKPSVANIYFDIPLDSNFRIAPLNFDLSFEEMIIEKSINSDTLTWWMQDSSIIKQDSLEAILSYATIDTLGNPITKHDTLLFEFRKQKEREFRRKKDEDKPKPKPRVYISPNYLAKNKKVDLQHTLNLELPTPIKNLDTSKIKLFEVFDTMTVDTRKQEMLKQMRLSANELYFKFRRPIAKNFSLKLLNINKDNWYSQSVSDSNRIYKLKITDPEVEQIDTIKLAVKYDNNFFLNQIQKFKDTLIMPLSELKILARKRLEPDEITLVFDRPITGGISVKLDDFVIKTNWHKVEKNSTKDTIKIKITDDKISYKDTLTLAVRCFNYINLKGDSAFFEQTMRIIYKEPRQFLSSIARANGDSLKIIFNLSPQTEPKVDITNVEQAINWYQLTKNSLGDTLIYKITNPTIANKDSLQISISLSHTSRKNIVRNIQDTLLLAKDYALNIRTKNNGGSVKRRRTSTNPDDNKQKVSINLPITYDMYADSLRMRNYIIKYDWKEDTKYQLNLDSMAFVDIYGIYNNESEYKFSTPKNSYYTALVLNLQDIHAKKRVYNNAVVNDTLPVNAQEQEPDTALNISEKMRQNIVGNGNIILHLLNKDNNIVREFFISEDKEIVMDFLHPGEYKLRVIYDKNNNGKWDTGNYFKKQQAERIIMNGKAFMLKTNFENKLTWDVGKTLLESCYAK